MENDLNLITDRVTHASHGCVIRKPNYADTLEQKAEFENPTQRRADMSQISHGMALMSDCMYSFSADENRLSMILLRSTVSPDPTADRGTHTIRYAFCPHVRTWTDADISNVAKAIAVEAVKSAEDGRGFILRCYESKGTRGTVNVVFDTVTLQFASRCPGGAQSAIFITSFKADRDSSGGSTTSVRSAYV